MDEIWRSKLPECLKGLRPSFDNGMKLLLEDPM
jgi:hypothetical protein